MTTLQEMIKLTQAMRQPTKTTKSVADRLLGSCKGALPKGKTSTQMLRELRNTLYGRNK